MEIKSIRIEAIPPQDMRYRTAGDWFLREEELIIQVADTGNWKCNFLVGIHELVEVLLCANQGISQQAVDTFDFEHEDDEDPGSHPNAPYEEQHITAFGIEMILAAALGMKWRLYEECIDDTLKKTPSHKSSNPSSS